MIDLFCGAGGATLGFVQAGFRPVFAVEVDRHASATYRRNFGDHLHEGDIRLVHEFPRADVVIGGPPCQGFSRLGKQAHGHPTEKSFEGNALWSDYMRCVEQAQPKVFVVENVPDFFKHFAWERLQKEARRLGYELTHGVLNAADFGVPQRRQRAIVVGSRIGRPKLPELTHQREPSLLGLQRWRTVRDAIGDLPLEPDGQMRHDRREVRELSLRRYRSIPPGGNRKHIPDEIQLACWLNKNPKSGGSADLMGRLTWDAPSLTIRTEFQKPEKGRYLHPEADRSLTVREGARLQTFPDHFEFVGSNFQVAKQIGNAVPVLLARRVAETVRSLLSCVSSDRLAG
ncbi:DNA cytosine methyltransferase [Mesorhizobium sp. C420B]|uniref:DNA cytosine methyltransferase n=1 Tax=Mesorhizobium sp. C420B TaxID=2956835 RepID=UPI0012EB5C9B